MGNPSADGNPMSWRPPFSRIDSDDAFDAVVSPSDRDDRRPIDPSTFGLLYESKDDRLVLFETREGHLVAIDSSKLV